MSSPNVVPEPEPKEILAEVVDILDCRVSLSALEDEFDDPLEFNVISDDYCTFPEK